MYDSSKNPNKLFIREKEDISLHNKLYDLLLEKKFSTEYYIGVKTTRICCRFGCPVNPPLKKNVIFAKNLYDLISIGLRECKICKPLSYLAPLKLQTSLDKIQFSTLTENELDNLDNIEITTWLKTKHDIDLTKYIRVKKMNSFLLNQTINNNSFTNCLYYGRYITPIGILLACYTNEELVLLEFIDRLKLNSELSLLQNELKIVFKKRKNKLSQNLCFQLNEYFNGINTEFTVPLKILGSMFQKNIMKHLLNIPHGKTISYKALALYAGEQKAIRAVANANARNNICILIPCHRVIGENQKLRGYAGGIERKQYLLSLESRQQNNNSQNLVYGI